MGPAWCRTRSRRAPAADARQARARGSAVQSGAGVRARVPVNVACGDDSLYWSPNVCVLARPEGDDAADRIVRRDADGDAIPGNHFDAEAAHPAAELGQHFMAGVALHTVEAPAVDCHDRALHVDEIVLAQTASDPFFVTNIVPHL